MHRPDAERRWTERDGSLAGAEVMDPAHATIVEHSDHHCAESEGNGFQQQVLRRASLERDITATTTTAAASVMNIWSVPRGREPHRALLPRSRAIWLPFAHSDVGFDYYSVRVRCMRVNPRTCRITSTVVSES